MEPDATPHWLDADEQRTWRALASVLTRLPATLDAQLQQDAGISHFEYSVMSAISEAPQRTRRLSEVAAIAEGSLPRLSQVVGRLERRGWVTRRPDPNDGRATLATLTDEGWNKVVATAPGHVEAVRRHVFDPLTTKQQRELRALVQRIAGTIDPAGPCPAKSP
jgi:DNA-binding MarR family transcriptional regulator